MSTRGERLKTAFKARGIHKQQALAAELGVHESSLTRWKDDAPMSLDSAIGLGRVLDISLDWLLLGRGNIDSHRNEIDRQILESNYGDLLRIVNIVRPHSLNILANAIELIISDVRKSR